MVEILVKGSRPVRRYRAECSCGTVFRFEDKEAIAWSSTSGTVWDIGEPRRTDKVRKIYCVPTIYCPVCSDILQGTEEPLTETVTVDPVPVEEDNKAWKADPQGKRYRAWHG